MIPKRIFFNFGLAPDFCSRPFGLANYLAIKSAKIVNDCEVFLHFEHAPVNNEWWEKTREFCAHVHVDAPKGIGVHKLNRAEYRSDVFRLKMIYDHGGIYLDCDTLCINPLDEFLDNDFVMAKEVVNGQTVGLCNAVMMGAAGANFAGIWLEDYIDNYDDLWSVMGVRRPWIVAKWFPDTITVLPQETFFKYDWTPEGLRDLFCACKPTDDCYVLHLWERLSYADYIKPLTVEDIRTRDSTYNCLARRFL